MSFRSLLFCPDETAARLVTQVLSELDFTVEKAHGSFAAVQRLTEEHFDALVVDCQNEQDASLLFKAARNSEHNGGSLSVAVVEGQAGVAKAFRIGANLVLTKPINVEQSKSTLRVARGLLKKAQPRSGAPTMPNSIEAKLISKNAETFSAKPSFDRPIPLKTTSALSPAPASITRPISGPTAKPAASVPFSGLVLESDPEPVTEAADAAVLESLPEIAGAHSTEISASALQGRAEPIAASTMGQAAAAALAPEAKPAEFRPAGTAPMVTNEPIVSSAVTSLAPAPVFDPQPVSTPSFSSLESSSRSSGGGRFLKILVVLAVIGGGGYLVWQQPKVRDYADKLWHRGTSEEPSDLATGNPHNPEQPETSQRPVESTPQASDTQIVVAPPPTASEESNYDSLPISRSTSQRPSAPESIEVQELPIARDAGKVTVTPKVQPIVVKNAPTAEKTTSVTPPPVDVVADGADAKLPELTPVNIELPKPAPGTVRISQGVSQGLLLKKVQPVYPSIAKQLNREGAVQLLATIDKFGEIKKVQVLGGDSILAKAAVDAVKQWEYRPYLLNGQPVEIETQITIVFRAK